MVYVMEEDDELAPLLHITATMEDLRKTEYLTDVILDCNDRNFPAHRVILAATSLYFRALFRSEWRDAQNKRYDLSYWNSETIDSILTFLYTGQLKNISLMDNAEAVKELQKAADYYEINDLNGYCLTTLSSCSLAGIDSQKLTKISTNLQDLQVEHLCQMAASLDCLFQDKLLTDVTLVCETQEFRAHKLVLAAGSPYFQGSFRPVWRDENCEHREPCRYNANIVATILHFLYTGQLKNVTMVDNMEDMKTLLEAADYFQVEFIVEFCFKTLFDRLLTVTNFVELYDLADKFNSPRQISRIEDFLSANFSEMSQSQDFMKLNEQQLQRILQHPNMDHRNLDMTFKTILRWSAWESQRSLHLEELINILDMYSCPLLLNELIRKTISTESCNSTILNLLQEISSTHRPSLVCHHRTKHFLTLTCFIDNEVHKYDIENNVWLPVQRLPFRLNSRAATVSYKRHIFILMATASHIEACKPSILAQYCPFTNAIVDPPLGRRILEVDHGTDPPLGRRILEVDHGTIGVLNDSIYVIGDHSDNGTENAIVQCYNPQDKTLRKVASPLNVCSQSVKIIFSLDNYLYVFRATRADEITIERYDPAADQWTEVWHDIPSMDYFAFCGTKLFGKYKHPLAEPAFHTFDMWAEETNVVTCDGGPRSISALLPIKLSGKTFLVGVGYSNVLHFYDVEGNSWVERGQSYDAYLLHKLSCCV